jgi:predicted small metal-binding protein
MKTMTCKQMGGPCDAPLHGNSADEVMAEGAKHIEEMAAAGDEGHKQVKAMMDAMQKDPNSAENRQWFEKFSADFAALPGDN